MRILIIGINYAPEETGIGPYTAGLAEHLFGLGHQVEVVTGLPHYPHWRVPREFRRRRRPEFVAGVRVSRVWHYVPARQSALRRAAYEATFLGTALLARHKRPDAVIGIVPSLSGALAAAVIGVARRVPYGVVFQDLMAPAASQSGIAGGRRVAGITARIEELVTRRAAAVAAVSPGFVTSLEKYGAPRGRVFLLRNWARIDAPDVDRVETRARLGWQPDETIVVHAGNMGLKQGLEAVIAAGRRVDAQRLAIRFVLLGDGSQRERLTELADGVHAVSFADPVPEPELLGYLRAADVLLVCERPTVSTMSMPSKLTSYFLAGRPVLAAVDATGTTAAEVRRAGGGIVTAATDPDALVAAVERLRADETLAAELGAAGRAYVEAELRRDRVLRDAAAFVTAIASNGVRSSPTDEGIPCGSET
ncbi:MAG: glycosyltransferase [Chloroflexota bacterium]